MRVVLWPREQANARKRKKGLDPTLKEPRPVLIKSHCPRLTVQEAFWPTLGIQVGLVLLAVEAQQTLLVAEMTDLPTPVDGFQQLPLALTGMAPGSLRALTEWSDLPLRNMLDPLFYDKPCFSLWRAA